MWWRVESDRLARLKPARLATRSTLSAGTKGSNRVGVAMLEYVRTAPHVVPANE